MRYGIYYAYWEKEWGGDYEPYVERVARLGFDILEISCAGLAELPPEKIRALAGAAKTHGITISGGYGPKASENIASPDPAVVANAFDFWSRTFDVLDKLGTTFVGGGLYSYWPVDYTRPFDKAEDRKRSVAGMQRLGELAGRHGITLGMEALNRFEGYLLNTAAEAVDYVKAVGLDNVKILLDTFHMNIEEDSITDAIRAAGPYLGHFHVGEANRRPPREGGRMDWLKIGDALRETGYDGTVVMEPFVLPGGQVGSDIKVWRAIAEDTSQEGLDREAGRSVRFLRAAFAGK
ncbi:MAG: sugar phosphate isomerase/epimerase [Clostridiales bacterium]|jgi:D-psicose/D-tagatose/L-ribulose 3-epimerase|nr:sugar phosphate isomerase/epimerase [Clostridiales bacterium]